MAERRMFAKSIIDSDVFLDMPLSTQALYFHLSMRADDDGFINNPKKIMRMVGATQNEIELLLAKRYLLVFASGVVVIKHWRIHNYIQKDRHKDTLYQEEKRTLIVKSNKSYTEADTTCIQNVSSLETQVRLGKDRVGKDSIEKPAKRKRFYPPTVEELKAYSESINYLVFDAQGFIDHYESNGWMVGKNKMKSWQASVRNWRKNDKAVIASEQDRLQAERIERLINES